MKMSKSLVNIFAAGVVGLSGCSKSEPAPAPTGAFDPIKFKQSFQDSPAEVHAVVDQAAAKIRNHEYVEAIAALDSLTSDEKVTDQQKKAITNAIQQIKSKLESATPGAAQ
jgi:hypothetical protein